jgi:hypothetical protein
MQRTRKGGPVDRWTGGKPASLAPVNRSTGLPVHRLICALLLASLAASPARAQGGVLVQGIADAEGWFTNNSSNLLTKNAGRPAGLLRLDLWGAAEPVHGLVFYAEGAGESGPAGPDRTTTTSFWGNQLGVRYATTPAFVVDVGKMTPIIGAFAPRHFSTRNPLIGTPDGYTPQYPVGAKVSGRVSIFDYRVAMVSLPTTHVGYQPEPSPILRPAVGGGITPIVGLRLGGSFTVGSYLNKDDSLSLPAGTAWSDFHQRVAAFDASYARGYLETHVEAARGTYDIPARGSIAGFTYYGEVKYTFTPRFFLAGRVERNDYPFIRAATTVGGTYAGRLTDFVDGEIGGGYRVSASALLKVSVRGDRWWVKPGAGFRGQGGHAIAIQLSQTFDLTDLIDRHE